MTLLVDKITGIANRSSGASGAENVTEIHLGDNSRVLLEPGHPNAEALLDRIRDHLKFDAPMGFDVPEGTQTIKSIVAPYVSPVSAAQNTTQGDIRFSLVTSPRPHILKMTHPLFETYSRLIRDSIKSGEPLAIVERDDVGVVDIRVPTFSVKTLREDNEGSIISEPSVGTIEEARALFHLAQAASCSPHCEPNDACIPFLYPDDGCFARAHEMCRGFAATSQLGKAWIYGDLQLNTVNAPRCSMYWMWHVAPLYRVKDGERVTQYVLDPCAFNEPVPLDVWRSALCEGADVVSTCGIVYIRAANGRCYYDSEYSSTNSELTNCRTRLAERARKNLGPPFLNCITVTS
jgi:Glutaminase